MKKTFKYLMIFILLISCSMLAFACEKPGDSGQSGNTDESGAYLKPSSLELAVSEIHLLENSEIDVLITIAPEDFANEELKVRKPNVITSIKDMTIKKQNNKNYLHIESGDYLENGRNSLGDLNNTADKPFIYFSNSLYQGVDLYKYFVVKVHKVATQLQTPSSITFDENLRTLNWDKVDNAKLYELEITADDAEPVIKETVFNSYVLPTEFIGKVLTIKVRAVNERDTEFPEFKTSEYSEPFKFAVLDVPTNLAHNNGEISWKKVANATKYELVVVSHISASQALTDVVIVNAEPISEDSLTQKVTYNGFNSAITYSIKVRAISENTAYPVYGTQDSESITIEKLAAPQNFNVVNSVFRWNVIENCEGYKVNCFYYDEEQSSFVIHEQTTIQNNYYIIGEEALAGNYKISVYALGNGTTILDGVVTNELTVTKLEKVTTLNVNNGMLEWEDNVNASQYSFIINENSDNIITISRQPDIPCNHYDLTGFPSGNYTVRIIAGGDGVNYINSSKSEILNIQKLQTTTLSFANNLLKWDVVEGATTYVVNVNADKYIISESEFVIEENKVVFNIPTELIAGEYKITVVSKSQDKINSDLSNEVSFVKFDKVPEIYVKNGVLYWTSVQNATNYNLKISYFTEDLTTPQEDIIDNGSQNFFDFKNYQSNTYFVSVEAIAKNTNCISSGYTEAFECKKLPIPNNPYVLNGNLVCDKISEGTLYLYEQIGTETTKHLASAYLPSTNSVVSVYLKALGDNEKLIDSDASRTLRVKKMAEMKSPTIKNGYLYYELPQGASQVEIKVYKVGSFTYEDLFYSDRSYVEDGGYSLFDYEEGNYKIDFKPLCNSGTVEDATVYLTNNRVYTLSFVKLGAITEFGINIIDSQNRELIKNMIETFKQQKESGEDITVNPDITEHIISNYLTRTGFLAWKKVQGAVSYTLQVGSENIVLKNNDYISLGQYCYYMLPENYASDIFYSFNIKANGNNNGSMSTICYMDGSVSTTTVKAKKLPNVEDIKVKNGLVTWTEVNDCYYEIKYGTDVNSLVSVYSIDNEFNIPHDKAPGSYVLQIRAIPLGSAFISDIVENDKIVKLSTPSNFGIEEGILSWSRIEVASTYVLNISELGSENAGSYIFSLEKDQISIDIKKTIQEKYNYFSSTTGEFSVTINVNGTIDSEADATKDQFYLNSSQTQIGFTLMNAPQNMYVQEGELTWDEVNGATNGYILKITHKDSNNVNVTEKITVKNASFALDSNYLPDTYYFDVQAVGDNSNFITSDFSKINFEAIKLDMVENARISDGKIVYDALQGASGYSIKLEKLTADNQIEYTALMPTQELSFWPGESFVEGNYYITIKAIGSTSVVGQTGANYLSGEYSSRVTGQAITKLAPTDNLYIADENYIKWTTVQNANHYYVKINYEEITQEVPEGVDTSDLSIQLSEESIIGGKTYAFPSGVYYVNVQSKGGDLYLDSNYRADNLTVQKLAKVTGLGVENGVVCWDSNVTIPYRLALYIDEEVISIEKDSKFLQEGSFEEGVGGRQADKIYFYLGDNYTAGNHEIYLVNVGGNTEENGFGALSSNKTNTLTVTKLSAPTDIKVDAKTNSIIWDMDIPQTNALGIRYKVVLYNKDKGTEYKTYEVFNDLSSILENLDVGSYYANITAYVYNSTLPYCHSAKSENLIITMPARPTGLKIENGVIYWNTISNVSGYILDFMFYEGTKASLDGAKTEFSITLENPDIGFLSIRDFSQLDTSINHCANTSLGKYKVRITAYVSSSLNSATTDYIGDSTRTDIDGYYLFDMFSTGKGTKANPYVITSYAQLQNIAYLPDLHYVQENNISIPSDSTIFNPIGTKDRPFTGEFNGQTYEINKLNPKLVNSAGEYAGMFGYIGEGGIVRNVTISSLTTNYGYFVGGIAGYNNGTIYNCKIKNGAVVTQTKSTTAELDINIGGIVGYNDKKGLVDYCDFTGYVSAKNSIDVIISKAGGIAGYNSGIIMQCSTNRINGATDELVSVLGTYAGGIVGYNLNTIANGGFKDTASGVTHITGSIMICTNALDIIAYSLQSTNAIVAGYAGGIVGYNVSSLEDNQCVVNDMSISYCASYALVICYVNSNSNIMPYAGGIAGYTGNGITSCYVIGAVYGIDNGKIVIEPSIINAGRLFGAKSTTNAIISNCYYNILVNLSYPDLTSEEFTLISSLSYSAQNYTMGNWGTKEISYFSSANAQTDLNLNLTYQYWGLGELYPEIARKARLFN